jgi:hypothetical protein
LQRPQNDSDRGTTDAEHDSKELLLQQKVVRVDTVVCLQQPAAAALRDIVQGIACRALHDLQQTRLRVQRHHLAKCPADRGLSDEARNPQRHHGTVSHLLKGPSVA